MQIHCLKLFALDAGNIHWNYDYEYPGNTISPYILIYPRSILFLSHFLPPHHSGFCFLKIFGFAIAISMQRVDNLILINLPND